jgi:MraZ protein
MFLGRFFHNLDDKGRLTIPSRFREQLSESGAYVMQGFDQNLMVLPARVFENWSQKFNRLTVTDEHTRQLRRVFFSNTEQVEIDRAGRMLIPQILRQYAGLNVNVVAVGSGDYFELWSPEAWDAQSQDLFDSHSIATRFADLMITSE